MDLPATTNSLRRANPDGVSDLASPLLLVLPVTGAVVGFLAGLLGIGGGFLMVPVATWLFVVLDPSSAPFAVHTAIGTSLATIVPTALSSARAHWRRGGTDLRALRLWAPLIVLGALGGGVVARGLEADALSRLFGLFVGLLAVHFALPRGLPILRNPPAGPIATRVIAVFVGLASALIGIGGAVLSVPALRAGGLSMHRAISTGAAIGFFIAVPGALGYIAAGWGLLDRPPGSLGFVNVPAWALLMVPSIAMAPIGAAVAHRTDADRLRRYFALFLALVAARMALA